MGYCTEFDLRISGRNEQAVSEYLSADINKSVRGMSHLDWCGNGRFGGNNHWYEWKTDRGYEHWRTWEEKLKDISKEYPDYVFLLRCSGENMDDEWIGLFEDGKEKFAEINDLISQWVNGVSHTVKQQKGV